MVGSQRFSDFLTSGDHKSRNSNPLFKCGAPNIFIYFVYICTHNILHNINQQPAVFICILTPLALENYVH